MKRIYQKDFFEPENTLDEVERDADVQRSVSSWRWRWQLMLGIPFRYLNLATAPVEKAKNCCQKQHWNHQEQMYGVKLQKTLIVKVCWP